MLSSQTETLQIVKIIIHCGIGHYKTSNEIVSFFYEQLRIISGQKPRMTYAKKPIAGFNLREKMPLGFYVTLRKQQMSSFYNRLVQVILPQTFGFRGLNLNNFDGRGNLTIPIKSIFTFPECKSFKFYDYQKIGLNVSLITTFKTDAKAINHLIKNGLVLKEEDAYENYTVIENVVKKRVEIEENK